jgi:hypothetical protein
MEMSLAEVRPSTHNLTNHSVPNISFPHMVYTVVSQKLLSMIGGPSLTLMFEVADSGEDHGDAVLFCFFD